MWITLPLQFLQVVWRVLHTFLKKEREQTFYVFLFSLLSSVMSEHFLETRRIMSVKLVQSCPTLCDPMGYTVHGFLHARILEWVAVSFPRGSSQPKDRTQVSHRADRFFTSEPPGKPVTYFICFSFPYIIPWLWCFQYIFIEDMTSVDNLRDDWKATEI